MATFLIKRGRRAVSREAVAHIARYDEFGEIAGAWCWRRSYDMSSNVPWGLRQCLDCIRRYRVGEDTDD